MRFLEEAMALNPELFADIKNKGEKVVGVRERYYGYEVITIQDFGRYRGKKLYRKESYMVQTPVDGWLKVNLEKHKYTIKNLVNEFLSDPVIKNKVSAYLKVHGIPKKLFIIDYGHPVITFFPGNGKAYNLDMAYGDWEIVSEKEFDRCEPDENGVYVV